MPSKTVHFQHGQRARTLLSLSLILVKETEYSRNFDTQESMTECSWGRSLPFSDIPLARSEYQGCSLRSFFGVDPSWVRFFVLFQQTLEHSAAFEVRVGG
jgi:hypothetical protein